MGLCEAYRAFGHDSKRRSSAVPPTWPGFCLFLASEAGPFACWLERLAEIHADMLMVPQFWHPRRRRGQTLFGLWRAAAFVARSLRISSPASPQRQKTGGADVTAALSRPARRCLLPEAIVFREQTDFCILCILQLCARLRCKVEKFPLKLHKALLCLAEIKCDDNNHLLIMFICGKL